MKRLVLMSLVVLSLNEAAKAATPPQPPPDPAPIDPACVHRVPDGAGVDLTSGVLRDAEGQILEQPAGCLPRPRFAAAAAMGTYENEYSLSYLSERASMFSYVDSTFRVPAYPPTAAMNSGESWRFSVSLFAGPKDATGASEQIRTGVSYGRFPGIPELTNLPVGYYAWPSIQATSDAQTFTWYGVPRQVFPGDTVYVRVAFESVEYPGGGRPPGPPPIQFQMNDPHAAYRFGITTRINNEDVSNPGEYLRVWGHTLGQREYALAFPAYMEAFSTPGVGLPTCDSAMPADGMVMFGPSIILRLNDFDPFNPTHDYAPWVRYGTISTPAGPNCLTQDLVEFQQPFTALKWNVSHAVTPPFPPNPVQLPAASPAVLIGLGLGLAGLGAAVIRRRRGGAS